MSQTLRSKSYGFTLIEMMVAISIAAILLAVAIPSFQSLIKRNAIENLQTRLAAALTAARSEAASRNVVTTLCSTDTGTGCVANKWSSGWIVFIDLNGDAIKDNNEEILQTFQNNNGYLIKFKNEANNAINSLSFTSQGFVRNDVRAYAAFCDPEKTANYTQGLTVERSGRVMKAKTVAFDTGTSTAPTNITLNCD
ncbi:MAG: GspH/FimT family pseudopilin [Marinagarivorans sp.]